MTDPEPFRRSSFCESNSCVEVFLSDKVVLVRNSKHPGHRVEFTREEWDAFIAGARRGEFGE